ncbi:hypothetical protein [Xylanibacter rodentium]|jgi:mRNA-degrading endonuclease RelE of RelBE toxin-antitoxin system|nr:hypothetical protein [Xylanibacter rodentium]
MKTMYEISYTDKAESDLKKLKRSEPSALNKAVRNFLIFTYSLF